LVREAEDKAGEEEVIGEVDPGLVDACVDEGDEEEGGGSLPVAATQMTEVYRLGTSLSSPWPWRRLWWRGRGPTLRRRREERENGVRKKPRAEGSFYR
jgi:hypothetical protein